MFQNVKKKVIQILRWTERYTQTDMVYLASGGFWSGTGQVVSSIIAFLLSLLFANFLPPVVFGKYRFILSIANILAIPTLAGINIAIVRSVASGFDGSIFSAIKTRLRGGIVTMIGSLGLSLYYFINANNELAIVFIIVAVFLPFFDSLSIWQSILTGKKQFKKITKYQVISQVISLITMSSVLILTDNLFIIVLGYFIPWTLTRLWFFRRSLKKFITNTRVDPEVHSYGKHLTLMNILGIIANNIDKIILFHLLGAAQVSFYVFAIAIPEQIKNLARKISTIALPKFAEKEIRDIKQNIWKKIFLYIIALSTITVVYVLLTPLIFKIFFPQYIDVVFLSQIFSISIIAVALFIPLNIMQSHKEIKKLYWFNITIAVFKILLMTILIYFFGLLGALLALVISRLFNLLLSLFFLKQVINQSP